MDILVVGGAGYIGSHICKALARNGDNPITLDDLSSGHRTFVKWGPLIECNILDTEDLIGRLRNTSFQAVVHLAARIEVGESLTDPTKFYVNNVAGSISLMHALAHLKMTVPFVFSSTAAVYGNVDTPLVSEDSPLKPINPYGTSKKVVEELLVEFSKINNMPLCILRYFNVAGADPDMEIGESHHPETHLIPKVLEAALDSSLTFRLFGVDYPTPDGTCIRDYVHVSDLAQAHVCALTRLVQAPGRHHFNIGYSKGHSVREILAAVERVSGKKVRIEIQERRPGDPPRLVADGRAGLKFLDWQPKFSDDLDKIIAHALEWQKR